MNTKKKTKKAKGRPELPQYEYQVVWHNDSACDTLGTYSTEQAANDAGNDWYWSMVAVDDNPKEAEEVYSFEVIEVEINPTNDIPPHQVEGTLANFDRYIAGDR